MKGHFKDRQDAARQLTSLLQKYKGQEGVVLAVPRGAVPMGYVIARELRFPLGLMLTKKIPHPDNDEYAIGAVSLDNIVMNEEAEVSPVYVEAAAERIRTMLRRKYGKYLTTETYDLEGKIVLVVDDGIATGQTMLAAIELLRMKKPKKIVVAVPVAATDSLEKIEKKADEVVCLLASSDFFAIGQFYEDFDQVSDEEVTALLDKAVNVKIY